MLKLQGRVWKLNEDLVNFGDYAGEIICNALGYTLDGFPSKDVANPGEIFHPIGSVFDSFWLEARTQAKCVFWGCGFWGQESWTSSMLNGVKITAVRGPLTQQLLGLNPDIPLGDPALLMPRLLPNKRVNKGKTLFLSHFHNHPTARTGCDLRASLAVPRSQWWDLLAKILEADFIMTNGLHGAIVAQAYGIPWAFSLPSGHRHDKPLKWADWAAYLNVRIKNCLMIDEGRKWWEQDGQFGVVRDLKPLFDAFPYPKDSAKFTA